MRARAAAVAALLALAGACSKGHGRPAPGPVLVYTDPPVTEGGAVRLVLNPAASTGDVVQLDLRVGEPGPGAWAAGLRLPVGGAVSLAEPGFVAGDLLDPGAPPRVASATIAGGVLLAGLAQKAAGAGAAGGEAALTPGKVILSLRLRPAPGAARGVVFDGAAEDGTIQVAVRDVAGNDVVPRSRIGVGRLEVR